LDTSVFLWLRKQRPKIPPDRTTEAIVPKNERWRKLNANTSQTQHVPLRGNIASHQLCRERQRFWKSHDGLNLTCSDQCHGVRFHGTSTLQVCQGKPSHRNICGCASNALRFAQGQPNGCFRMKELERTDEPIVRMNVE